MSSCTVDINLSNFPLLENISLYFNASKFVNFSESMIQPSCRSLILFPVHFTHVPGCIFLYMGLLCITFFHFDPIFYVASWPIWIS